jgi:hypothetical protein
MIRKLHKVIHHTQTGNIARKAANEASRNRGDVHKYSHELIQLLFIVMA